MSVRDDASADEHTRRLIDWIAANENRRRVVDALAERPRNANQLASALGLHYRTITHHLRRLTSRGAVTAAGERYGQMYFPAERIAPHVTGANASGATADGLNASGANGETTEDRDVD